MISQDRAAIKAEDELYREAAARITGGTVRPLTSVNRPASGDGAFVEVVVWVSKDEIK